jgi:hypothetical protein
MGVWSKLNVRELSNSYSFVFKTLPRRSRLAASHGSIETKVDEGGLALLTFLALCNQRLPVPAIRSRLQLLPHAQLQNGD